MEYAQISTRENIFKVISYYSERPTIYAGSPDPENIMSDEDMKVINIYPVSDNIPVYDDFYQDITLKTFTDWTFDSTAGVVLKQYNISTFSFTEKVKNLIDELAEIRFEKETRSIRINGSYVATTRESQSMLSSAYLYIQKDLNRVIDWKCDNTWIVLDATSINVLVDVVPEYIEDCFAREKELWDELKAVPNNDWTALKNIDLNIGWPSNIIS
jgi:hypothetical protein